MGKFSLSDEQNEEEKEGSDGICDLCGGGDRDKVSSSVRKNFDLN